MNENSVTKGIPSVIVEDKWFWVGYAETLVRELEDMEADHKRTGLRLAWAIDRMRMIRDGLSAS